MYDPVVLSSSSTHCVRVVDTCGSMKITSSFLYALALLFAMTTVLAQDCIPSIDLYETDAQGSDGTIAASGTYQVENSC